MSVTLSAARYREVDGLVIEDYEEYPDGPLDALLKVVGNGGCTLEAAGFTQR